MNRAQPKSSPTDQHARSIAAVLIAGIAAVGLLVIII
jgi:hypothetical protein